MSKVAVFSAVGLGATGAGGFGIYSLLKEKPVITSSFLQRIDTKKRVILKTSTNSHDSVWAEITKEYSSSGNISEIPKDTKVQENLKKYCQSKESSVSNNKAEFEQYRIYCTRENLMSKLSVNGKSWNSSKDESKWETSRSTYSSSGEGDLLIPKTGGNISKEEVTKKNIMDHCETISSKPFINSEDADYKRGEKWCLI